MRHVLAILILPANVLGTVPALLLWRSGDLAVPPLLAVSTVLGLSAAGAGLALMVATIRLFVQVGRGTLAPWDPTERLVVLGPYRRVRNPMISGVLLVLLGEALVFRSGWLVAWWAVFFLMNATYIPLVEEPGLEARFGDDYRRYRREVPRWIPRTLRVPPQPPSAGQAGPGVTAGLGP